jgi:hypothetical protein
MDERDEKRRSAPKNDAVPEAGGAAGPRRSPQQTRFQPGRSGNPDGRPTGARGRAAIIARIAAETHPMTENGKRRRRSTVELVLLFLRNQAVTADGRAIRATEALRDRFGPQEPRQEGGCLIVPECLSPEEWAREASRFKVSQERFIAEIEARYKRR